MWCIVNLPNGTQQAVKWDPKAIGQECLEKVCKALDIICEMEYFGLEHWAPNQKESRTRQWINLRNRLSCDGTGGSGIPLMLALRVKFWVPVHFILQDSVRNLFYMQAKSDLLEGRLNARNWSNAAKLAAFLCQADGLIFNEATLKAECPLKMRREHEKRLQEQQQQLLQQQQQQQQSAQKERKDRDHVLSFKKRRLSKQKSVENIDTPQSQANAVANSSSAAASSPSTSSASVNSNSASTTASTMPAAASTSSCPALTCSLHQKPLTSSTNETTTKVPNETKSACDICSLNESIENTIKNSPLRIYQDYVIRPVNEDETGHLPDEFLKQIAVEHGKLAMLKMSPKSAKYWLLHEIQDLPGYGEEVFCGFTIGENSQRCDIAVGAHGIRVSTGDNVKNIPFSAIAAAKSFRRTFKLEYVDDNNDRREVDIKLPKHCIAAGLYRSITERHAFYVCDKVRGVVTNQFTRDLKGTIASMFKEDTELGKKYIFDIRHTSREVIEEARRVLHKRGIVTSVRDNELASASTPSSSSSSASSQNDGTEVEDLAHLMPIMKGFNETSANAAASSMACSLDMMLREKEEREAAIERCVDTRISEAMTCKICMDNSINTMFNPCCHVMACSQCAARCDKCPNCRVKVTDVVKIYLPPELRSSSSSAATTPTKSHETTATNVPKLTAVA
ncbi:E3 ubiquitin-protein ligase MYLIP [Musca vetustissima]|uniref:E3 ubiquitin-protein ligase MYLIP n=1 Tax=Musca vetustissima TaxID=27455 RepID=UPI002AB7190A|nr:E3 ubiquitin-protein ligase MYLIP [Musca vetustissima]